MQGQTQTIPIAHFRIDDKGMLKIKWEKDNKDNVDLSNYLRNCPLRIAMSDCEDTVIYLREPVVQKPIDIAELMKKKDPVKRWSVSVDDVPDIPLDLEVVAPCPTGMKKPEIENGNAQTWLLKAQEDESICFRLQVEHKGREKDINLFLADLGFNVGGETVYASTVAAYITRQHDEMTKLDEAKKQKEKEEKDSSKLTDDEKQKYTEDIRRMRSQIGDLEKYINVAIKKNEIYQKLAAGKINYRVYLPIGKYQVDLIRTDWQKLDP
jgi:hypothetical protein